MPPFSGKFVLRIPPNLHKSLTRKAEAESISLNQLCSSLLASGMGSASLDPGLPEKLRRYFGPSLIGIILFGSQARGTAMDTSDTDLLLVFAPGTPITRALYRKWEDSPDSAMHPNLSLHCVNLPDLDRAGSLWLEVALDGIVLWESEKTTRSALRELKREIAEGRYVREKSHGHGYWRKVS